LLSSLSLPRPPRSTPFPYTTLFRSHQAAGAFGGVPGQPLQRPAQPVPALLEPTLGLPVGPQRGGQPRRPHLLPRRVQGVLHGGADRKSTRLNSSHVKISYAVFCLKK